MCFSALLMVSLDKFGLGAPVQDMHDLMLAHLVRAAFAEHGAMEQGIRWVDSALESEDAHRLSLAGRACGCFVSLRRSGY